MGCHVWVWKDAMRMHLDLGRFGSAPSTAWSQSPPGDSLTLGGPTDVVPLYQKVPRALGEAVQQQQLEGGRNNHH